MNKDPDDEGAVLENQPFPSSLCHACAAPPRHVTTDRGSTFIYCPILKRYPPQPVRSCEAFLPRPQ
jgi:hypothetical protein